MMAREQDWLGWDSDCLCPSTKHALVVVAKEKRVKNFCTKMCLQILDFFFHQLNEFGGMACCVVNGLFCPRQMVNKPRESWHNLARFV